MQELMHEHPNNRHVVNFPGFTAVVYSLEIASDPEACHHVIEDANGRNMMTGSVTMVDRLPRALEPSAWLMCMARGMGPMRWCTDI